MIDYRRPALVWPFQFTFGGKVSVMTAIIVAAVLIALPAAGESDTRTLFLKHWQVAKEFTLAVAEAMPAESYDLS